MCLCVSVASAFPELFRRYMKVKYGNINVVKQLGMELDRVARGEEYNNFFAKILFEKGKQQQEALFARADHISLL